MQSNTSSKSGLFLMELIIAILFFSLSGAICVQLFVQSHLTSKRSVELNHAVEWCQNVAEAFYGCEGNGAEMIQLFENSCEMPSSGSSYPSDTYFFTLTYDKNFQPNPLVLEKSSFSSEDYAYFTDIAIYEQDELLICDIQVRPNIPDAKAEIIYELQVYLPLGKETAHE